MSYVKGQCDLELLCEGKDCFANSGEVIKMLDADQRSLSCVSVGRYSKIPLVVSI